MNHWILPNELWKEIIETATYVHAELSTNLADPFACRPQIDIANDVKSHMHTRRRLCLVSHRFYDLAVPIFYQTLLINSSRTLGRFAETVQSATASSHNPPLGEYVQRLHVAVKDDKFWRYSLDDIPQIYPILPNLKNHRRAG